MEKVKLLGSTLDELSGYVTGWGMPSYTAKQIAQWIYKRHANDFNIMTDISEKNRRFLAQQSEIGWYHPIEVVESIDGTKKYLFKAGANRFIESVYIPEEDRSTLCVSSQAGCRMGCKFCLTGKQGFNGHLTATDIINQIRSIPERDKLTNLVFMGMGEPLDNFEELKKSLEILTSSYGFGWSPKRITVSTVGIIPTMIRFLNESKCHLAISLHSPFHEERLKLMPVEKAYPIEQVVKELKKFDFNQQRRLSFEYIMLKGINDTSRHVKGLVRLLNGLNCRINLIRYHAIPGEEWQTSDDSAILSFQKQLKDKGIITTLRASRGQDIWAACGMLSTDALLKS
ncbi:MAG: 23S rRNA (adenine(2503)-C(2))-methyltransferase RlmN [Bacteroidales bacterium]|nr:23S rRNA (adenine(2503)-C(2))-methyltransferase RlmN [Bacteroidales bacterium]